MTLGVKLPTSQSLAEGRASCRHGDGGGGRFAAMLNPHSDSLLGIFIPVL